MTQASARRLESLLDGVERILSEEGWDGRSPRAFFAPAREGVTALALPACRSDAEREALAAIVLHHMLGIGADQCALAVPGEEPGLIHLDGHRIERGGIRSVRRALRLAGARPARQAMRLSA